MNIVLRCTKTNRYFLNERWWCSQFLAAFLLRKLKNKVCFASWNYLITNPVSNPLQKTSSNFQIAAWHCKSCAACDQEHCLKNLLMTCELEKSTNDGERKQVEKFWFWNNPETVFVNLLWSLGIDPSLGRAGTATLFVVPARQTT